MTEVHKTEFFTAYPSVEYHWDKFEYRLKQNGLYIAGMSLTRDKEEACKTVWMVNRDMEMIEG